MKDSLFLVTTEASGDNLGTGLVRELKKDVKNLRIRGVGGDGLIAQGMDPIYHVKDFNVMGLFEVLSQLSRLKRMFNHLVEAVKQEKPAAILLIDAPDFNIRFAKALQGLGIPIIYYVSPQVWAWRAKRARQIAGLVNHMMVLFPFEVPIYEEYGLKTTLVGHPLKDELKPINNREAFFREKNLDMDKPLVILAPGSRKAEVSRLLPVMVEVAKARADRYQFALTTAPTIDAEQVHTLIEDAPIQIWPKEMRTAVAHADAALVASGTATLETALLGTPLIVAYKMKTLSYQLAKRLVKVPHISLVNIVLGERVVPELVQADFNVETACRELDKLITDQALRRRIKTSFEKLRHLLGDEGAASRAAAVVREYLTS